MQAVAELWPKKLFLIMRMSRDLICLTSFRHRCYRKKFSERNRFEDIKDYWYKDVENFKKLSKRYYIY
jgi:hypothetical protein